MKIKEWLRENWIFVGIILFTIGIRIYYFILTQMQTLWWDEAEYMNMAGRWAFGTDYLFGPVRPVLFSFLTSFFLKITNSELLPRLFMLLISIFSVIGIYYLGKELYGKGVGLVSSFLMSIFYLNLFFTYRLLVDLPSLTFFTFSAFFFYKYYKDKSPKFLYLTAGLLGIGTLFKLSTAFIAVPFLIFLLMTSKLNFFKRKEIWLSSLIFLLILAPYIIWGYFEFGGFVLMQASAHVASESYLNIFPIFKNYISNFPAYLSWPILIALFAGIIFMYKNRGEELRRDIYVLLILIIPLILISYLINHNEDRYILTIFPAIFIISGSFLVKLYSLIKVKNKIFAILFIILILGFTSVTQITSADSLIKSRIYSSVNVRDAGLWLKDNSNVSDIIATKSQPQIRYYSGRKTIGLPPTEQEFENQLNLNVKFYMISIFEVHPEWAYNYPIEKNLTIERAYITQDQKATLIIYSLK